MDALGGFAMMLRRGEIQFDVYPPDHQHTLLFLDFPYGFSRQMALARRNVARLQRTSIGSDQSAGG
jgi:hypothetical protein